MTNNEMQDIQDCIDDAKESLGDYLDGGANYLRRFGADNTVSEAIYDAANGAVPIYQDDLLNVFRSSSELWSEAPDCGFEDGNGIMGAIRRVIYDAITQALHEYANELEGESIMCEEDGCDEEDDHDEPDDEGTRCLSHCGGLEVCEACQEKDKGEDCGSCGANIGPSNGYPWHYEDEDCRAVRVPVTSVVEGRITHAKCGCLIGQACICARLREHIEARQPGWPVTHEFTYCRQAIQRAQSGEWDRNVLMPNGQYKPLAHIFASWGLDVFLPYSVGQVNMSGSIMGRFPTEQKAAEFIDTLPNHADGRYYLNGPNMQNIPVPSDEGASQ